LVGGGSVGYGTALQAGFNTDAIIGLTYSFSHSIPQGTVQPLIEMITRITAGTCIHPVCRADNLTTFMCRLSRNTGKPNPLQT